MFVILVACSTFTGLKQLGARPKRAYHQPIALKKPYTEPLHESKDLSKYL